MIFTMRIAGCCSADPSGTPKVNEGRWAARRTRCIGHQGRVSSSETATEVDRRKLAVICDFILYD